LLAALAGRLEERFPAMHARAQSRRVESRPGASAYARRPLACQGCEEPAAAWSARCGLDELLTERAAAFQRDDSAVTTAVVLAAAARARLLAAKCDRRPLKAPVGWSGRDPALRVSAGRDRFFS